MATEYRAVPTGELASVLSRSNHRLLKILEAIMLGIDVEIDGNTIRLCESSKGGVIPAILVNKNKGQVQYVPEMSIAWLSDHVARMSEKEFERIFNELALEEISFEFAVSKALSIEESQG